LGASAVMKCPGAEAKKTESIRPSSGRKVGPELFRAVSSEV
jgi:hypothetical protein